MNDKSPLVIKEGASSPACVLREYEEFGFPSADLVYPPRRFWGDQESPVPAFEGSVDASRLRRLSTPSRLFDSLPDEDTWIAQSRRSVARLRVFYLICEDPQRRLDARAVSTLSHQISLVHHVLENDQLRRVLIADEVGLGKTVEVGLLIVQLLEQSPGLRVLYLAPARLVNNVRQEFERLGLSFRQWTAGEADGRLTDPRVIASIHRAVHAKHFQSVVNTAAWDVLVVDECHHLSDWALGGGDPKEKFKLVRELIAQQHDGGRVLFLSGTPHQGHIGRFENLLGLLQGPNEKPESMRGRVIYRTKEDIRDWHGNPLFPKRQVNDPLVVDLGPAYRTWVQSVHDFYRPPKELRRAGDAQKRAAGWRWAQALQWAVSSPQAGLGYLVRQAIRAGLDLQNEALAAAVAALRPYRSGRPDEPVYQLFERMLKEVKRQKEAADLEDIEEEEGEEIGVQKAALERLLTDGIAVLRESGDQKWRTIKEKLLDPAGDEKIVLFAQPIETVTALAHYLEQVAGTPPALIIGGQSDAERRGQVELFWRPDGPQFLVSSRAGGEGINLQVARRLVHIDVPWNPMDLEQRVGRVHRFGSRKTILVDTVVVKDSREAQAYRIARQRLNLIASTLVEPERFEAVFARVMCLVPPEALQDVLLQESFGPIRPEDQEQIARMVQEGFQAWRDFHERFAEQQKQIRLEDPGLASWHDVEGFLREYSEAQPLEGFNAQRFLEKEGRVEPVEDSVNVLSLGDGQHYFCGDTAGAPVFGQDGRTASQLGLNLKPVCDLLRRFAFPSSPVGAACLRWPRDSPTPRPQLKHPFGVLVFLRQTVKADQRVGYVEQASSLHCYVLPSNSPYLQLLGQEKAALMRGIFEASPLRSKPDVGGLFGELARQEPDLANELRKPIESEMRSGIRHAVTPLFTAVVVS